MEIQDRLESYRCFDQADYHVRRRLSLSILDVLYSVIEADGQLYRRDPITSYPSGDHHVGPIQYQQLHFHGVHVHVSPCRNA
jgi:hypothetical protein